MFPLLYFRYNKRQAASPTASMHQRRGTLRITPNQKNCVFQNFDDPLIMYSYNKRYQCNRGNMNDGSAFYFDQKTINKIRQLTSFLINFTDDCLIINQHTQMFRFFSPLARQFAARPLSNAPLAFLRRPTFDPLFKRLSLCALPLFLYSTHKVYCLGLQDENQAYKPSITATVNPSLVQNPKTLWEKVKSWAAHIFRLLHLIGIFIPPLLCLPLRFFKWGEKMWLRMFVNSVQRAGVVWIKAFQYLSHRRDVIGPEMAESFTHLRQNAPQHSFEQTRRIFKKGYGKQIEHIFDQFDEVPIASGSVSQVYKAIYKGKKVAVKVRHPEVDKYIQRDVNILFGISKFLSLFSKAYEIPVGQNSLKKTLIDQIDFNIEKDNLNIFNKHFIGNEQVNFPQAFQKMTRDSILIQTFVEGVPVTHFEQNRHPLNAVIARLGASTFFEMLMKNNFIHADCHGGNILVQVTQKSFSFFSQIKDYIIEKFQQFEEKLNLYFLQSPTLRQLYSSSREEQKRIRDLLRRCTEKVKINVIDVGMVIQLNQLDRNNFVNFIKSIIEGNSETCANMIFRLSNFEGKKVVEGKFVQYKDQLRKLFSVLDNTSIFEIEGINLLIGMLDIIRNHNMKLDGEFATLITNMVVLESIAKEIDPEIQILKCAIPYFKFVQAPIAPPLPVVTNNSLLLEH